MASAVDLLLKMPSLLMCAAHLTVATDESEMVPAVTIFEGNAFCSSCFTAALKRSEHMRVDLKRLAKGVRWRAR